MFDNDLRHLYLYIKCSSFSGRGVIYKLEGLLFNLVSGINGPDKLQARCLSNTSNEKVAAILLNQK